MNKIRMLLETETNSYRNTLNQITPQFGELSLYTFAQPTLDRHTYGYTYMYALFCGDYKYLSYLLYSVAHTDSNNNSWVQTKLINFTERNFILTIPYTGLKAKKNTFSVRTKDTLKQEVIL